MTTEKSTTDVPDLMSLVEMARLARENADAGRIGYLTRQVTDSLSDVALEEIEWLSTAVANAAMERRWQDASDAPVETLMTPEGGEVWDI